MQSHMRVTSCRHPKEPSMWAPPPQGSHTTQTRERHQALDRVFKGLKHSQLMAPDPEPMRVTKHRRAARAPAARTISRGALRGRATHSELRPRRTIGRHETVLIFNIASRLRENTSSCRAASQVATSGHANAEARLKGKRSHEDAEDSGRSRVRIDVTYSGPRAGHRS